MNGGLGDSDEIFQTEAVGANVSNRLPPELSLHFIDESPGGCGIGACCIPSRRLQGRHFTDISILAERTGLKIAEVEALYARFRKIAPKGSMNWDQFRQTLGMLGMTPNDYIPKRMFAAFDEDGDGVISFGEYLHSFSILLRGSEEARLNLSFRLADSSNSGKLSLEDFKRLVNACQSAAGALTDEDISISEKETSDLFFEIAGGLDKDYISETAYMEGVRQNVRFLEILGLQGHRVGGSGGSSDNGGTSKSPEPVVVQNSKLSVKIQKELDSLRVALKDRPDLLLALSDVVTSLGGDNLNSENKKNAVVNSTPRSRSFNVLSRKRMHLPLGSPVRGAARKAANVTFGSDISSSSANGPSKVTTAAGQPQTTSKRGHTMLGPRRGLAVHFGHENWNMVLNMMIGIRLAVGRAGFEMNRPIQQIDFNVKDKFSIIPSMCNCLDSKVSSKVTVTRFLDYAPLVFRKIREQCSNISEEEYLRSVGPEQLLGNMVLGNLSSLAELSSEGKGGAFFYYTADGKYMLKTVTKEEKKLLKKILRSYYDHLVKNPKSLIVRFYGLHGIRLKREPVLFRKYRNDEKIYFVVMGNFFSTPLEVHRRFDLKGSWVGRRCGNPHQLEVDNSVALKDLEFIERGEKILIGGEEKDILINILKSDVDFFQQHDIVDYSLLLGIHELADESLLVCDEDGFLAVEELVGNGIMSTTKRTVYYLGIIDILCVYDARKKMEHFFKSLRYGATGISAVPPEDYGSRFLKFIETHVE